MTTHTLAFLDEPRHTSAAKPREATDTLWLTFDDQGLLPAIAQHVETGEVLMLAWMNETAVRETLKTGLAWFYSRSRKQLWQKGESSGHVLRVREIRVDCDQDTLLLLVEPAGPTCHTGARTCFYRSLSIDREG
jgi:phosphoribosyl-AMP cyclohydrolase